MLHDSRAATRLDGGQSRGAVVKQAGQHDPDHTPVERQRGRAEEWIDRRPRHVLTGTKTKRDHAADQQQVPIGRGEIDVTRLDRLSVDGLADLQGGRGGQHVHEEARTVSGHVCADENAGAEVGRKSRDEHLQDGAAAG